MPDAVYVNAERTVLVRVQGGVVTVALRDEPAAIWGPPVRVVRES